jgi:ligand-binding sensor domain-containing protein/signal transduction histidine kinase
MSVADSKQKHTCRRAALLAGLLLAASWTALAEQLPIKTYTTADGLAQNLVNRIVRDSRGYLWFCTAEGLSRFDGYRFTNYTTDQGLPHRSVRDLLETRAGAYWVATGAGLCRFDPQSEAALFVVYHPGEGQLASIVRSLYEDRTGTVWVGTQDGLYRLEDAGGQVRFQPVEMGMPAHALVESILEDRRGALWVGTRDAGLYRRLPDGSVERYTTRHGLPINRVSSLLEDREGRLWIGTTAGLCLLVSEPDVNRPAVVRVYGKEDFGLSKDWVAALFQSADGRIWVGTASGLSEFTPAAFGVEQKFRSYTTAQGLNHTDLSSLADDSAGNLWIGASNGAMKLARNGFITHSKASGLDAYDVACIFETRAGELCVLARDQSARMLLNRFDERGLLTVRPDFPKQITNSGWGWNQYGLQDHEGEWWIPTGKGLCRFPGVSRAEQLAYTRPKALYTTRDGLIADEVFRIYEDSRGDIWIAPFSTTKFGLTRWERSTETFYNYTQADGLPPEVWAEAFCEDSSGNVWIGVGGNLARYTAGRFTLLTAADGLPRDMIRALHLDHAGRLWVATEGGLSRVDDPKSERPGFVNYTTANGLSSNQVWCVTSDLWGRVYAFTGRGLDRLDPASGQVKHYTSHDGLIGGAPKAAFRDRRGVLWFGTDLGFSRLVPELDSPEQPPPILISGLRVSGDRRGLSELGETEVPEIRLGPNENQLQIDYVGLSFGTGEQIKYQYMLEGTDANWSAPTDQRSINYAGLSPGSYRFLVRAVRSDGTASPAPAAVAFTILPPVWQRWWFVGLAALALAAAAYGVYRYRVRRLLELERVRTRIAADLHDDIGASLSRIAILSEVVKRQVARSAEQSVPMLTDIADSARGLVGSMRDIVWAIDPRRDDLGNVVARIRQFASDVLEGKGIKWDFSTPPEIDRVRLGPDQRRHILLFFKEAITNVARHSGCAAARLSIEVAHNRLVGEVRDDGLGFAVVTAGHASTNVRGGQGLENMRRRVSQLGGTLSVDSSPGQGARLRLTIPLKRS